MGFAAFPGPAPGADTHAAVQQIQDSNDPALLQRLGILYIQENRPVQAIQALQRAADLYPDNAETHMWLGFAYFLNQQFDLAEESYRRAQAINPRLTEVHNYLGMLYAQQDDHRRAIAEFRAALQDPAYPPTSRFRVKVNLGRSYLEEGDLQEALAELTGAVEMAPGADDPAFVLAHLLLGRTLRRLGRLEETLAVLEEALEADSESPDVHLALGLVYRDLGDTASARRHLQAVLRLAPGTSMSEEARHVLEHLPG